MGRVVVTLVIPMLFAGAALAFRSAETPVRVAPGNQWNPVAGGGYLGWTAGRDEFHTHAYFSSGGDARRVNPPNTFAWTGGIDGTTLVYQQIRGDNSDVKLYDLATGGRSDPPTGVNTGGWEWHPSRSGEWLMYGRGEHQSRRQEVLLRRIASGEERVLERRGGRRVYLYPGQVNGDYATWTVCIDPTCTAYRYQISTHTRAELPKTGGAATYGASVTPEGTVYYGLSANACGARVRIVRWGGSGAPAVVQQLPNRLDFMFTYAVREEDGSTSVLYDRGGCGRGATSDIYKVVDLPSGF